MAEELIDYIEELNVLLASIPRYATWNVVVLDTLFKKYQLHVQRFNLQYKDNDIDELVKNISWLQFWIDETFHYKGTDIELSFFSKAAYELESDLEAV